jgi:peptide/nickel transport system permease protein
VYDVLEFVRQRCWGLLLVVAGVCIITFIISHLIPGDPARLLAGDRASDEIVQPYPPAAGAGSAAYGSSFPLCGRPAARRFRHLHPYRTPGAEDLKAFFPATLELAFCSLLLALVIGVPLGILSAVYRNRWLDHLVRLMAMTGISTPAFWLGLGVIVLFYGTWNPARRRQAGRLARSADARHRLLSAGRAAGRQRRGVL